jgi:CRISPR system Cascade subunit CasE
MYLSQLVLNARERKVQQDLSNVHALHQRIMQGFPDENRENSRADWNVLYRQEIDSPVVLVQSTVEPDWVKLPERYLEKHKIKPLNDVLNHLAKGERLQFRLKANPSKRSKETGKTIAITGRAEQVSWLERKGEQNGFQLLGLDVIPVPNLYGRKSSNPGAIKIVSALYQGTLEILDAEAFKQAVRHGIGRGRSYGCGLLSLAPLNR